MDVYEQGMFYANDTDSYYNFILTGKHRAERRRREEEARRQAEQREREATENARLTEEGAKYNMSASEFREFEKKVKEIQDLYPSVNDYEILKQYVKELGDLQKEYRTKNTQTRIPSERKQFSALLNVIADLLAVKTELLKDLTPVPAIRPRPIGQTIDNVVEPIPRPNSQVPVSAPVPILPTLPPTTGQSMPPQTEAVVVEREPKQGLDRNKLLIFGGIGVVGILVLYKLFKK
jgi:hypothetical protein